MTDDELNMLVAEIVMGWTAVNDMTGFWQDADAGICKREFMPEYVTSIADAWQVVEKMRDGDERAVLDRHDFRFGIHNQECYSAEFTKPSREFKALGRTAGRAICVAALRACGHDMIGEL